MFATSQDLIVHLIHHCDLNTAMKRQPQVGPRKYKRRRKLKPHELEMISSKVEDEIEEEEEHLTYTDSEEEKEVKRKMKRTKKTTSPKVARETTSISDTYTDLYNSCSSAIENINSIVKSSTKKPKKVKHEPVVPSRPKMIHTQKTRVPVEPGEDGKIRHKTRTLVTRTQPTELKSATGERIRPRTKNVSYHVLSPDKLPAATFPEDPEEAVNNLLKDQEEHNGVVYTEQAEAAPEVASEQVIETDESEPVPTNIIRVTNTNKAHNLRPGRHIIGPGTKMVRLVKGGMIITKKKKSEPENILPDHIEEAEDVMHVKQELLIEASPLHELAELSMQHAQNIFKCEMCSAVFSDRAKLLDHVPIHI